MALTGYRIDTYMDVNPNSPTFQQTKEERVSDSDCVAGGSQWEVVSEYCETDEDGANTGYYVTVSMDIGIGSPTFGETRETRELNRTECPEPSKDPSYSIDMTDAYCVTKHYPKSGLDGETGELHVIFTDENIYSPTFGETKEGTITIDDWDDEAIAEYGEFPCEAVDETPQIEPISEACELVKDEYGNLVYNGYKNVTGLDKNPYSDTYLETVTERVEDVEKCPTSEVAIFEFKDGNEEHLTEKKINVEWYNRTYTIYMTSTRGGITLPYEVNIPDSSWMTYDKPTEDALVFSIEKNNGASDRTQNVTLKQNGTSKEIKLYFTQAHAPYYFYYGSNVTASTVNVGSSATSNTLSITSLRGDEFTDYTVSGLPNWISYTRDTASGTITFSISANTSTLSRKATITMTQSGSNNKCEVTYVQEGVEFIAYNFQISSTQNGTYTTELTYNMESGIGTKTVYVKSSSTKDSNVGWSASITEGSSWIKIPTEQDTLLVFTIDGNTTSTSRTGKITLTQNESNEKCTITIVQEGVMVMECEYLFNNGNPYNLEDYDYLNGASLPISANCDWNIRVSGDDTDVISVTPKSGKAGQSNVTVTAPLTTKYSLFGYSIKLNASCTCSTETDEFDINFYPYQFWIEKSVGKTSYKVRMYMDDGSTYDMAYPEHMYDQWYKRWIPWESRFIGKNWYALTFLNNNNTILTDAGYDYVITSSGRAIARRGNAQIAMTINEPVYFNETSSPMVNKTIECGGGNISLTINNPKNLTISLDSNVSWITPSMSNKTLNLSIDSYTSTTDDRSGVVTLTTSNQYSLKVFVTQKKCTPTGNNMGLLRNKANTTFYPSDIIEGKSWSSDNLSRVSGGESCTTGGSIAIITVPDNYDGTLSDFHLKVTDNNGFFASGSPTLCSIFNVRIEENSAVFGGGETIYLKGIRIYAFWTSNSTNAWRTAKIEVTNDKYPGEVLTFNFTQKSTL